MKEKAADVILGYVEGIDKCSLKRRIEGSTRRSRRRR